MNQQTSAGEASISRNDKTMMTDRSPITCLFLDIGGVLLTNGWGHESRRLAVHTFGLDLAELEERHHLNFETFEIGKLTRKEYLNRIVFYQPRPFSRDQFWQFICTQSKPYPEMIELVTRLRKQHGLKIIVVSNEARELNAYRIQEFKLDGLVDAFISSCYVGLRKPDTDIFRLALDIARIPAESVAFIDNTPLFVQIAEHLGMQGIVHTDTTSTAQKLAELGLRVEVGRADETS